MSGPSGLRVGEIPAQASLEMIVVISGCCTRRSGVTNLVAVVPVTFLSDFYRTYAPTGVRVPDVVKRTSGRSASG